MSMYPDGSRRRILLKDVAERAHVSGSTASRALSDDPRISVATRQVVKAAALELHYVPNAAARSLRVRRTRTLGLLIPDLRDPVHGQVASAFEREARHEGYGVMIVAGERDLARERRSLRIFSEHGADGVAVVASVMTPKELRERVDPSRLILVWPDHRTLPRQHVQRMPGVIQTDDASGVRAATAHLIDAGCRRIGYVASGIRHSNSNRAEMVAATMRAHGLKGPVPTFDAPIDPGRPMTELATRIAADRPDALVCYDDQTALGLIDALRDVGVQVPRDLSVVGFDGIPFAAIANPRLTTVAVPSADMGRIAAESLIRAIHGGYAPEGALLNVELVVRESTRATAGRNGAS